MRFQAQLSGRQAGEGSRPILAVMQEKGRQLTVQESEQQLRMEEYAPGIAWYEIVSQEARGRVQQAILAELERRTGNVGNVSDIPMECLPDVGIAGPGERNSGGMEMGREEEEFG